MSNEIMTLDKRGCFVGKVNPDEYHKLKSHYSVSKSMLTEFAESPYRFKYNRDRGIKKSSSGFGFGNLVDMMAFTPEEVEGTVILSPYDEFRTKEAKEWKALQLDAGKMIVTRADLDAAEEATSNLNEHLRNEWGLVLGETFDAQVAWACRLKKIHGVSLTATGLLDILPREGTGLEEYIFDGKTVGKNIDNPTRLSWDFYDMKYHVQGGMYIDGMNLARNNDLAKNFVFVCVESVAPYRVRSYVCNESDLEIGSVYWKDAVAQYAECLATDVWPGKLLPKLTGIVPGAKVRAWEMEGII